MAWLAVDKNGFEYIFHEKPIRIDNIWVDKDTYDEVRKYAPSINADDYSILLPKGTIERLLGYKLSWDDEPINLYEIRKILKLRFKS